MTVDYREYIQSKEWKAKAKAAKHRAGYRCEQCGVLKPEHLLHAHHLTYERLGNERKSGRPRSPTGAGVWRLGHAFYGAGQGGCYTGG
jgi:hypothetical protein